MKALDSRIQQAVQILWCGRNFERGAEAKALLEQAAAEGNADAYCFLARCYAGSCFVEPGFGLPEDDDKVEEYLNLSIENGSAIGMFSARRFGGFKPRCGSFVHEPYHSDREIWNEVCELAGSGNIFARYLVANAYYYGDVGEFLEIDFSNVSEKQLNSQFRQWAMTAISMYEDLISHNMFMGLGNYIDIITSGDYGVPKNEKRAQELCYLGAEKGIPFYMVKVGQSLEEAQPDKAIEYYKRALNSNYPEAGYYLGMLYTFKGRMPRNLNIARVYFENCLNAGQQLTGCNNMLGEIYFYGGDGIERDYNKAFRYLLAAHNRDNYWGSDMLGTCYLKGLGTSVDYMRAKEEFEHYPGEALSAIGLGEIYAYGLGVPVDIKKAMTYWDKFPEYPVVIEHKKHFKKSLLGGWKRI